MSNLDEGHASDNEFYDAMDNLDLNDQKHQEKILEQADSSDEEDFVSLKPSDASLDHEKPFVPLHEQLNKKMEKNRIAEESDDEEVKEQDPYFVDEELLKEEEEKLSEEEKQERLKEAQVHKQTGNEFFKQEKYHEALEFYTKSLRLCPLANTKERSVFYSNRSVCFFKLKENEKCINECTKSIEKDPEFVKPYLRRAECFMATEKLEEALEDYKKLSELEPKVYLHKQKCIELEEKIKEKNEKLKEEMMGKLKELGNMVLKPFGLSTSNFQFVQDPNTGSYSVNFKKD